MVLFLTLAALAAESLSTVKRNSLRHNCMKGGKCRMKFTNLAEFVILTLSRAYISLRIGGEMSSKTCGFGTLANWNFYLSRNEIIFHTCLPSICDMWGMTIIRHVL